LWKGGKEPMVYLNQIGRRTSLLVMSFVLMATLVYNQRKPVPSDVPEEARQQSQAMYAAVGKDRTGRLGVTAYDPGALTIILEGLESHYSGVRSDALYLIELMLRQWKMPPEALETIARKVRLISEDPHQGYVRDIEWQLGLLRARSAEVRLRITREGLYSPSEQIVDWAIQYLVEVGGEEAKRPLREAQRVRNDQGLREKAHRLAFGLKMIEVNEKLARRANGDQLEYLWQVFQEHVKQKPGWGNFEFILWLMDKIESFETSDAAWRLKQIYQNTQYDEGYRYAAQEALVRKGVILPNERKLIYIY
jgi:hypothetical protein